VIKGREGNVSDQRAERFRAFYENSYGIGSQRRGAHDRARFLIPLSSPCVRFSRTRLSDDLLGMAYAVPG
jgi:hypothetical protein